MSPPTGSRLVSLEEIRETAERLRDVVVRTPLLPSAELAEICGAREVRLKCENLQRTGAFKARGALNFLSRLSDGEVARGVVTHSSGNHAGAVALAAKLRGVRAIVVMPTTAPAVKVEGARSLGADVRFAGTTSLERRECAEALAADEGLAMVPPHDHAAIIAGQGTVGLEVVEDWPEVDMVLVPIGGGGLASGVAAAVRRLRPASRITGVEPAGGASMSAALEAGAPVTLASTASIADGLLPVRAGELPYRHVAELADGVVLVEDDDILDATRFLLLRHRLVVEFSGAATTAALLSGAVDAKDRRVAVVLSGGNLDPAFLEDLL